MKKTIVAALLFAPGLALGQGPCDRERTQTLELDTAGISALQISIGPDSLRLEGHDQEGGSLSVRMCASTQQRLDDLAAALERQGDDRLVLALDHGGRHNEIGRAWFLFSYSDYGRFEITGRIPARLAVDLTVGSGDAVVKNVAALEAVVGSGDLEVDRVGGPFMALVGSGSIEAERTGAVDIGSIGSGDIKLRGVEGDARVGNIGAGQLDLRNVSGAVSIGAIGSGDAKVRDVVGDVEARALGSGAIEAHNIGGNLTLRSKGSGSVDHGDVRGSVSLPNR